MQTVTDIQTGRQTGRRSQADRHADGQTGDGHRQTQCFVQNKLNGEWEGHSQSYYT